MAARLTDEERLLRTISEARWQKTVTDAATLYGWLWYHAPANRPVGGRILNIKAGFPDLVLVRGDRMLLAELKTQLGKTTPAQDDWLWAASQVPGVETYIWRPGDRKAVMQILGGRA